MKMWLCELCNAEAAVFCPSDAAFLCCSCDAKVHEANFLVARHVRESVCSNCKNLRGQKISGVGFSNPFPATCPSCSPASAIDDDDLDSVSSSTSSVCISRTTSPGKGNSGGRGCDSSSMATSEKRRRPSKSRVLDHFKAEGVFANWSAKLGVEVDSAVRTACKVLKVCWTVLPFRVCLASSMWLGLRLSLEKSVLTWKLLKRLEEISGVPAKIILASESRLERALKGAMQVQDHRRRLDLEEGWAENDA